MAQHSAQAQVRATTAPQHYAKPHAHHSHAQGFGAPSLMFDGRAQVRLKLARAGWGGFVQRLH